VWHASLFYQVGEHDSIYNDESYEGILVRFGTSIASNRRYYQMS
jgi:hypothetical protein